MATGACIPDEIEARILDGLRRGRRLKEICGEPGMPHVATVLRWVSRHRDGFGARYHAARREGAGHPGQVTWSEDVAARLLDELGFGRTVAAICRDPGMPDQTTIGRWVREDRAGFAARFREARAAGHGRGGPVGYSAGIADLILGELMAGRLLTEICAEPDMPAASTVQRWARDDRDGFAARYRQARELGCDMLADEVVDIADDRSRDWMVVTAPDGAAAWVLDPQRLRRAMLQARARRWRVSKLMPRRYAQDRRGRR